MIPGVHREKKDLEGPPPWAVGTPGGLCYSCRSSSTSTATVSLRLIFIPVVTIIPNSALLMIGILILVGTGIPLLGEGVLVEAPLIPILPVAALEFELLPLLVGYEISTHAPVDHTAVVGLERTGHAALVMRRGPLTVAVDVME